MGLVFSLKELLWFLELSQFAILSKDNLVRLSIRISRDVWSWCLNRILNAWVSFPSWETGNKKNNSSSVFAESEKLSTNWGINLSIELRVSLSAKLQFKDDSWYEYIGLIKLLKPKSLLFESLPQLASKIIQIKGLITFKLDQK